MEKKKIDFITYTAWIILGIIVLPPILYHIIKFGGNILVQLWEILGMFN
jgi:hypothetical protein